MKNSKENLEKKSSLSLLLELWAHISRRRKTQIIFLMFFNIVGSFSESFSIAMTLPLISVLIDPSQIWSIEWIRTLFLNFGISSEGAIITPITLIFIFASIVSTLVKLSILWSNNYFAALIGNDLSCLAYERTLYQPYENQIELNSSEVISAATSFVDFTVRSIYNFLNFLSYLFFVISIQITLLFIDWHITLSAIIIFIFVYLFISFKTKSILVMNGKKVASMTKERVKSIQEGIGSIRDMLLANKQEIFVKNYANYDLVYRKKLAINKFLRFSPRYIIENIGFIFIAILAYSSTFDSSSNQNTLSILGTFAVAAQKLLPSMQQCYNSIGAIRSNKGSIIQTLFILCEDFNHKKFLNLTKLNLRNKIVLSNISFKYFSSNKFIFKDINLTINKGDRVGILGETGCGKSTLVDIIMGLLTPSKGNLIVDNQKISSNVISQNLFKWRMSISHVPQNIFLSDKTIAENIAYGLPVAEIDMKKVIQSAEIANISNFINSKPNKFQTNVGENGLKLSGGQRQRIGIARALYKDSEVIIFDEATSALDDKTESNVMDSLNMLDKNLTIIIVAHRLSTLKKCNKLIKIDSHGINSVSLSET